jgi:hypothetical protein
MTHFSNFYAFTPESRIESCGLSSGRAPAKEGLGFRGAAFIDSGSGRTVRATAAKSAGPAPRGSVSG